MARYSSIAFLWFFTSAALYSQTEEYHVDHLAPQDGLSDSCVGVLTQDSKGFLWIPTWLGLNRYDGYTIREYTADPRDPQSISNNIVSFVYEDPADSGKFLWVGTYGGGLNQFNRETERFTRFQHDPGDTTTLSGDQVHCIYKISPEYYLIGTTSSGVSLFDRVSGTFRRYQHDPHHPGSLSYDRIRGIFGDRWGNIWITTDKGLNRLPPVYDAAGKVVADRWNKKHISFIRYYHDEKDSTSLPSDLVFCVYEDRQGVLWVGTEAGLRIYDWETDSFHRHRFADGYCYDLDHGYIYFMTEDAAGNLWVAIKCEGRCQSYNGGLIRINPTRDGLTRYHHDPNNPNSLSGTAHLNLIQDRSGIIWTSVYCTGVDKLVPVCRQFRRFTHIPGESNSLSSKYVSRLCEDSTGILWIGTLGGGVNRFDRKQNRFMAYRFPGINQRIRSVSISRAGEIWASRRNCLTKFDPKTEKMTIYNLDDSPGSSDPYGLGLGLGFVFEDRAGVLWCLINFRSGGSEVYQFDEARRRFDKYQVASHPEAFANALGIYEDRGGALWFFTLGHGLLKRIATGGGHTSGSHDQFIQYKHRPGDPASLSSNRAFCMIEDSRGLYWIGTENGLNKLNPQTGTFTHYLKADGLPSDRISSLAEDDRGNLWMCTFRGLSRFNPETEIFQSFDESDGLPKVVEYGYRGLLKATNGEMYCAYTEGFFVFHPDSLTDNTHVPPIVLTDFRLFNQSVPPGKDSPLQQSISEVREIRLAHHQDVFSFEFAALDFTSPKKNRYAYKMEGVDRDWVYTDASRRFATYTKLDPGEYTFRVKGCNNDGVWNEEGVAVRVIIIPPFWQRLWFQLVLGLLVLSGIIGVVRYFSTRKLRQQLEAVEQQRAMEKERTRISSDMHDEVGASLTHIAIASELLKKSLNQTQKDEVQDYIEDISRTAREVIDHIGEIIWAINPRNDSLDNLMAYIRQYAGNFFEVSPIRCRYDLPEHVPPLALTSEVRRNFFLVVKEALHNVLKHAAAEEVQIKMALAGDDLELSIADNGKGFCQQEVSRFGNGLNNMQKRMADIGGRFEISSRPGEGTVIKIRLRLKNQSS